MKIQNPTFEYNIKIKMKIKILHAKKETF